MRLGAQKCPVEPGTLAHTIYGAEVNERHRHRYEVNNIYVPALEAQGYKVSARTPSENLARDLGASRGIRSSSACSSIPSSLRRRAPGIRCSRRTSRRPSASTRARSGRAARFPS
jgi:hypothetical protein